MNMSVAFDTLSYANQMKQAGFTEEQAEVQTKALANVMSELSEGTLATKQDVLELKFELKQDLIEIEKKLENKIQEVETKLTIRLGAIMTSRIAIISALMIILKLT